METPSKDDHLQSQGFFASNGDERISEDAILQKSPVPLSKEESQNDEIRALAARLAPTLVQAEELLASESFSAPDRASVGPTRLFEDDIDEDDGIQQEVQGLKASEDLLRQELEMASEFSRFFGFSLIPDDDVQLDKIEVETPIPSPPQVEDISVEPGSPPRCVEADVDEHQNEAPEAQGLPPIPLPSSRTTPPTTPNTHSSEPGTWISPSGLRYSHADHMANLHLQSEQQAWYAVHLTHFLSSQPPKSYHHHRYMDNVVQEYCIAVPPAKFKRLATGLVETNITTDCVPVRTLTMRIRPDVLCGAVMEAVHHALQDELMHATIHKRQGGHIQAWVPGAVVAQLGIGEMKPLRYPPFVVDLQVVAFQNMDACERRLVMRVYHPTREGSVNNEDAVEDPVANAAVDRTLPEAVSLAPSLRLRECSALIQRMESPDRRHVIRLSNQSIRNVHSMRDAVAEHLLKNYRACPSVKKGGITLPSLNAEDFTVIQSSWRLVQAVWDELETRELGFSTLAESRFGAFPALPTLDVHFCSHIRRLSREAMVVQLLKSASDLEEYAREAEYSCANMISLLKPTFEAYGIEEPALPKPVPLTAYPLDFVAPQTSCPPWGVNVQHALNEIQAWTAVASGATVAPVVLEEEESRQSFELAQKSVRFVLQAFQQQDDEEQSARLMRKNVQVMDRLAKMQAHQRMSIERLHTSASRSDKAAKAAEDFFVKAGIREVPLIKWSIVVGGSTGTCSITANHIMFVTQLIPVFGGNTVKTFFLKEVDFNVSVGTPSILNPLPTVISVFRDGHEVYSFRPSMGGARLKAFLDLLKKTRADDPLFVPS